MQRIFLLVSVKCAILRTESLKSDSNHVYRQIELSAEQIETESKNWLASLSENRQQTVWIWSMYSFGSRFWKLGFFFLAIVAYVPMFSVNWKTCFTDCAFHLNSNILSIDSAKFYCITPIPKPYLQLSRNIDSWLLGKFVRLCWLQCCKWF